MVILAVDYKSCNFSVCGPGSDFLLKREPPSLFTVRSWSALFSRPDLPNVNLCSHKVVEECCVLCGVAYLREEKTRHCDEGLWQDLECFDYDGGRMVL